MKTLKLTGFYTMRTLNVNEINMMKALSGRWI